MNEWHLPSALEHPGHLKGDGNCHIVPAAPYWVGKPNFPVPTASDQSSHSPVMRI